MVIMTIDFDETRHILEVFVRPTAEVKQAQKRERILLAATELFVKHGYRKTSVGDVARQAGVAKGTVYLYYNNKAELLFHAVALEKLHYISAFKPLFEPSMPALDSLRGFIALGITWAYKLPLLARFTRGDHELELVMREVDVQLFERVTEIQMAFVARLIDAATNQSLAQEVLQKRTAALMDLIFALVNGGRMIQTGIPIEEYAHLMADVIVCGIVHAPSDSAALTDVMPRLQTRN